MMLNDEVLNEVTGGGLRAPWDHTTPRWHLRELYYLNGVFQNYVYGDYETKEAAEADIPKARAELSAISATGVNVYAERNG